MRLIDADALSEAMYRKSFEADDGRQRWDGGLWIRYKVFEEARDEAPTVDAVPVRHGRWKRISPAGIYECTKCGQEVMTSDIDVYDYCHGCGAEMESLDE